MKLEKKLKKIKNLAVQARTMGMLPYALVKEIYDLSLDHNETYIEFLSKLTEDFMRIRGYYHKNKSQEENDNKIIIDTITAYKKHYAIYKGLH